VKYGLEFILQSRNAAGGSLRNQLSEFAENLQIFESQEAGDGLMDLRLNMVTEDPTVIFDICSQFGRIKTVKIDEIVSPRQGSHGDL